MQQTRIYGSNMLAATAIVLVILATGVRNELANVEISKNSNSKINYEMISNSNGLQERLTPITKGIQQNTNSIEGDMLQNVAFDQRQENSQWPTTCAEALLSGNGRSGIYQLYLHDFNLRPFEVQCLSDPDNGPAWTIIQRRQDNSTDFYRGWREYQRGFGDLNTNYFIGLNRIHLMTRAQPHELWIELADFQDETRYAKYNSFAIGDEYDLYRLHTLGQFAGNAGDALTYSKGYNFTTKDSNNNMLGAKCAANQKGAWWYWNCAYSNLNGIYQNGITAQADGIFWLQWRGFSYSLKYVHMAIRPKK